MPDVGVQAEERKGETVQRFRKTERAAEQNRRALQKSVAMPFTSQSP